LPGRLYQSRSQLQGLEGDVAQVVWGEAATINPKTKKKRMELRNSESLQSLPYHQPGIGRHEAVSPGGPGDGVVALAIAQRRHPTLFGSLSNVKSW